MLSKLWALLEKGGSKKEGVSQQYSFALVPIVGK
jgi:hypothetical protein